MENTKARVGKAQSLLRHAIVLWNMEQNMDCARWLYIKELEPRELRETAYAVWEGQLMVIGHKSEGKCSIPIDRG